MDYFSAGMLLGSALFHSIQSDSATVVSVLVVSIMFTNIFL